jgi:hypothetical protein
MEIHGYSDYVGSQPVPSKPAHVYEAGLPCSADEGNDSGEGGDEEGWLNELDWQQMLLEESAFAGRQACNACNDLDWLKYSETGCHTVPFQYIQYAGQRGCKSCSLILDGVAEAASFLGPKYQPIFKTSEIWNLSISASRNASLSVDMSFLKEQGVGPWSMSLEFFFPSGRVNLVTRNS